MQLWREHRDVNTEVLVICRNTACLLEQILSNPLLLSVTKTPCQRHIHVVVRWFLGLLDCPCNQYSASPQLCVLKSRFHLSIMVFCSMTMIFSSSPSIVQQPMVFIDRSALNGLYFCTLALSWWQFQQQQRDKEQNLFLVPHQQHTTWLTSGNTDMALKWRGDITHRCYASFTRPSWVVSYQISYLVHADHWPINLRLRSCRVKSFQTDAPLGDYYMLNNARWVTNATIHPCLLWFGPLSKSARISLGSSSSRSADALLVVVSYSSNRNLVSPTGQYRHQFLLILSVSGAPYRLIRAERQSSWKPDQNSTHILLAVTR